MADRILLVDDDPMVMEALKQVFEAEYEVLDGQSGFEALEILGTRDNINAIVLDIRMAEMDGLETARKIHEINPELPIIFHTGFPGDYSEGEIEKEYQPFDYVIKSERGPAATRRQKRRKTL